MDPKRMDLEIEYAHMKGIRERLHGSQLCKLCGWVFEVTRRPGICW